MSTQAPNKRAPVRSTWTPMSHDETNAKYFDERRQLITKWFEKWTEDQRKTVLDDLLSMCKLSMLENVLKEIEPVIPKRSLDFTLVLPQHLVLTIFSYLDPRSLCRCSQVNTHWKWIAENDSLWIIKCAKLGWTLSFEPTPFERGVWKANYVEHFKQLQQAGLLKEPDRKLLQLEGAQSDRSDSDKSLTGRSASGALSSKNTSVSKRPTSGQKPWRAPDKSPMDTWRYNYLDDRELENATKKPTVSTTSTRIESATSIGNGTNGSSASPKKHGKNKLREAALVHKYQLAAAAAAEMQRSSSLDRLAELTDISRVNTADMLFVGVGKPNGTTNGLNFDDGFAGKGAMSSGLQQTQSVTLNTRPLWAQPRSVQASALNGSALVNAPTASARLDNPQATGRSILSTNGNGKVNGSSSKTPQKTRFRTDDDNMFSPKPWNTNVNSGSNTPASSQR